MRREDIERPVIETSRGKVEVTNAFGKPRPKGKPRVQRDRVTEPPIGEGKDGCPMCARAGRSRRVVFGKDRCIDHLAEAAETKNEGLKLEQVMQSTPVKKRTRLPGALS